jgi:ABC-2 type transport system permease protein
VALLAGLGVWIGAATQNVHLGLLDLLGAGANVVPPAMLVLGIGAVVLAVSPRAAAPAVYALVGGSLVISLLGSTVSSLHALERISLFHYMALVPAQDPDPVAIATTLAVAVALAIAAVLLFRRRDVSTG